MSRSRGKRYDTESKLNIKKVIAVILAFAVIIMFFVGIKTLLSGDTDKPTTTVTSYFSVYTNDKWGVIDQTGKIVINPEYDEMITIPDSKTDIFLALYDVDYTNNTYKTKVLNSKGEAIFEKYDLVEAIENKDSNNILWFEEGVLKVKKNDSYGLINYSGDEILAPEYSNIEALEGIKNSLIIKKDDQLGLCDNKGNIIISTKYKEIKPIGDNYKNGYIVLNNDNKYGVIDFNKNEILEEKYEEIKPFTSNNIYIVKENKKLKVINSKMETLVEGKFDDVKDINSDNLVILKDKKYGVINTNSETVINAQYDDLKFIFDEYYMAKKSNKYGVINSKNENVIPFEYSKITYRKEAGIIEAEKENNINSEIYNDKFEKKLEGIISNVNDTKGYIRIRIDDEYKYFNFKLEEVKSSDLLTQNTLFLDKKDGKYGYVDKSGNVVINYIYEDATEQNSFGYAAVKKDGLWSSIDKEGNIQGKYELKNNLVIDFIGKYHLGEDLNSYYYTDAE